MDVRAVEAIRPLNDRGYYVFVSRPSGRRIERSLVATPIPFKRGTPRATGGRGGARRSLLRQAS